MGSAPNIDAKMAVRRVYFNVSDLGRRGELVDADLSDYFSTIPHGPLMRCIARRVSDRKVLAVMKAVAEGASRGKNTTWQSMHNGIP